MAGARAVFLPSAQGVFHMSFIDRAWPELELTEEERQWCDYYASDKKPGVLRRTQQVTLVLTTFAGEQNVFSVKFASSGRRTRVFGLTFSGDTLWWRIRMTADAGETFITPTSGPGAAQFAFVRALQGISPIAGSLGGLDSNLDGTVTNQQTAEPLIFDPNILLEGTQEIKVDGDVDPQVLGNVEQGRSLLHVGFHYWEFPDYPRVLGGVPGRVDVPNMPTLKRDMRNVGGIYQPKKGVR